MHDACAICTFEIRNRLRIGSKNPDTTYAIVNTNLHRCGCANLRLGLVTMHFYSRCNQDESFLQFVSYVI